MAKIVIQNPLGGDIFMESTCHICGKVHSYRLKERQICSSDECYKESQKRRERQNGYGKK